MNKILFGVITVLMVSCSSAPFKANVDNELLVGKWTISNVDDAAAMVSKEEFLLSAMHEKYKEGYVFNFEKGPKFSVLSTDGVEVLAGNYGIGVEDKSITLQLIPDSTELSYDLSVVEGGYNLTVTTPGEMVNLTITK
ncbi:MAG: hypothetical protein CMD18_08430 [Flavobacteriales bacterium]|nr:hypothetical protein [Flavobacteriales bacterium]|tara:strand:- start:713 stop:1126 length:414 start_codon:yes stop_codon:yes gene_type:complete